jgi:hypothetical protein
VERGTTSKLNRQIALSFRPEVFTAGVGQQMKRIAHFSRQQAVIHRFGIVFVLL